MRLFIRPSLAAIGVAAAMALSGLAGGVGGGAAQAVEAAPRSYVTGWFGWWADSADVATMASQSQGVVGEANIFWWAFAGADRPLCTYDALDTDGDNQWGDCLDGTATPWTNPAFESHRTTLQAAGIKVFASITDLNSGLRNQLSDYLATPENRAAYAAHIADWAQKAGVDGVDLDWENFAFNDGSSTWATTKPRWVETIKVLAAALHDKGLLLAATVPGGAPPFQSDGTPWDSTTYWVYAWSEIAPYIDRLRIMAYDYSWDSPGAIGPNDWAGEVVRSAVAQVGATNAWKVQIGQPQYGRNWVRFTYVDGVKTYVTGSKCPAGWKPTSRWSTPSPAQALALATNRGITPTWDATHGEWTFRYSTPTSGSYPATSGGKTTWVAKDCNAYREVWWGDTRAALARSAWVPKYQIGGIAVWSFDTVNDDFYSRLADYGRTIARVPTSVSVAVAPSIVVGEQTAIRVTATSTKGVAANARADLYWKRADASTWSLIATRRTDANGAATFTSRPRFNGEFRVRVSSSWWRLAGWSAPSQVVVQYAVTMSPAVATLRPDQRVTLTGHVTPVRAGIPVRLRQRIGTTWKTVAELVTGTRGNVTARVLPGQRSRYRFYAQPTLLNAPNRSAAAVITMAG